ncbi:MAG: DUF523 domain-containing protein [Gammaproteobacteria bacterium]|nr:DUF523 domain-containing protein [Gammaproteobacteria bacterium]
MDKEQNSTPHDHSDRPVIAVSRCLLGEPVRYDGQARPVSWIIDILSQHCEFLPVCPELEAGFGVPRPPIRQQQTGNGLAVVLVDDPTEERTEKLEAACASILLGIHQVDGLILKARSPSCAVDDTPVFNQAGSESSTGVGLFTRKCLEAWPGIPVIDEQRLESEAGRVSFLVTVFRYCCRRRY